MLDDVGRVLTVSRPEPTHEMVIPGGLVDPGETAEAAAVRELQEECGIRVGATAYCCTLPSPTDGRAVHVFAAVHWSGAPVACEAGTTVAWLTPEELVSQASLYVLTAKALLDAGHLTAPLAKAEDDEAEIAAFEVIDWSDLVSAAQLELGAVAQDSAKRALALVGIDDDDVMVEQVFTGAVDWAKARAAELVGKKWVDGELVDNPDAEMAISDTMRDAVREATAKAIEDGDSAAELADTIEGLGEFSAERAEMIARTEIVRAHNAGSMQALRASSVVELKEWTTAEDDDVSEECRANADQGPIPLDDDFESGDDHPPLHPRCRCVVVAHISEGSGEAAGEEDEESEDDEAAAE